MFRNINGDVKFVRWPAQADLRNHYRKEGIARLLIVEGTAEPPVCIDPREDWVRPPISRIDLDARVKALRASVYCHKTPVLDSTGTLRYNSQSVIISTTQTLLMELFIARFEDVVYRNELERRLAENVPSPTRNSLDLHIMRLRQRLNTIDLVIRTVWARGYLLEPQPCDSSG